MKKQDPNVTMKLNVKRILRNCLNPLPSAFGQDYMILRYLFTSLLTKVLEKYVGVASNFTIGEQNWRDYLFFQSERKNLHLCRPILFL